MELTNQIKIRLTGTRPLLMSRGEAANPFDPQAQIIKSISGKKKKSLEDHEQLSRLQFESSLYFEDGIGPVIPTDNLWKCMQEGASRYKEGPIVKGQCTIIGLCGTEEDAAFASLIYSGPRDVEGLYKGGFLHRKMGRIMGKMVLVTRAIFNQWAVEFIVEYVDVEKTRIVDYWKRAEKIGLGTWRVRYGLFSVEVIK